jgi:hypothetical protein
MTTKGKFAILGLTLGGCALVSYLAGRKPLGILLAILLTLVTYLLLLGRSPKSKEP